jgi:hypothetical protein
MAFTDLQQYGMNAKLERFGTACKNNTQYANRVQEEKKRVIAQDKQKDTARASMHKVQRWKAELLEAFDWFASTITPVPFQNGSKHLIGRLGFLKLVKNGKLLGTSKFVAQESFKAVDPAAACFIPFDNLWGWFLHHAELYDAKLLTENKKSPGFRFKLADILTPYERAVMIVMKKVNSEKLDFSSDLDWGSLEEKRRRMLDDMSSSSEEESEEEEVDEDTLFSDPNYLKNADIGRLMRYLTKKKQRKEELARQLALESEVAARGIVSQRMAQSGIQKMVSNNEDNSIVEPETGVDVTFSKAKTTVSVRSEPQEPPLFMDASLDSRGNGEAQLDAGVDILNNV